MKPRQGPVSVDHKHAVPLGTTLSARVPGAFENTVVALYKYVVPKPKSECSKGEQLGVSFAAGYIAGVFCAIVSHPADNMVSTTGAGAWLCAPSAPRHTGFRWLRELWLEPRLLYFLHAVVA